MGAGSSMNIENFVNDNMSRTPSTHSNVCADHPVSPAVGGSGSGSGSGAGAVPGTMPNLSHHPTMETALENDSRAASHSKEGVASHYDGA